MEFQTKQLLTIVPTFALTFVMTAAPPPEALEGWLSLRFELMLQNLSF
jgi:hypothetical protein